MSEPPRDKNESSQPDPDDPFSEFLRQLGSAMPQGSFDLPAMLNQLQQAMNAAQAGAASDGVINWAQTKATARQVVASLGPDPTPNQRAQRDLADSDRLAELWLDQVTAFPQLSTPPVCWSRAEWVEHTMDAWQVVVAPIITSIANAMANMIGHLGDTPEVEQLAQLNQMLSPLMRQAAGSMYAMQLAQAIGQLATQVVTGSEIGLQLLDTPRVVLLPGNQNAFSEGLGLEEADVRLWLVLRESARQRLFTQVGWLGPQLLALLEHYAREITIDTDAIGSAIDIDDVSELTPDKLAEVSAQLQGRMFAPTRTPEQEEILGRLETLLALIEGWVDVVTQQAAQRWMPDTAPLSEAVRRRRAAGGPAEKLFQALVGLQMRPRRVRDAVNLWTALDQAKGIAQRDAVWAHPDLMPTAADLDDPLGFVAGESTNSATDQWDAELANLLAQEGNDDNPGDAS